MTTHGSNASAAPAAATGTRRALAAAGLALGLAASSAAHAQVECGDIIGPNRSVVLHADLVCSTATGGITVVGPARLDLNGHRIECADEPLRPVAVALVGRRAQLRNGYVGSCFHGVEVAGIGGHRVERVDSAFNQVHGFNIASDGNVVRRSRSSGNAVQGFVVAFTGDRNTLEDNTTFLQDGVRNLQHGFRVSGNRNKLRRNRAIGDGDDGFFVSAGEKNVLTQNESLDAAGNGFFDQGRDTSFARNTAARGRDNGFVLIGSGRARVVGNQAIENGRSGIANGSDGPVITRNTALNNRRLEHGFDLEEFRPACGTSTWRGNTFLTFNQSCIE